MTIEEEYEIVMHQGGFTLLKKSVIKLYDAVTFLGNLTVSIMRDGKNAFIDRLGKLIVLFDQKIVGNDVFIVFEEEFQKRLMDHLSLYAKLSKTKIEKCNLLVAHIIP